MQAPPGSPNPYVGPRSYLTGETLYGRDAEAVRLRDLMLGDRILLLFGPSGAGKTSLIQAALIPFLQAENFFCLPPIRLNQAPVEEVDQPAGFNRYTFSALMALGDALPPEERPSFTEMAVLSLGEGVEKVLRALDRSESPVFIFDQFEELLTLDPHNRESKLAFIQELAAVLRNPLYSALFVLREDYLAALDPYLRPLPTRLERRMRLDLLTVEGATQAIQYPARACGVEFADAAALSLVDNLRKVQVQLPDGSMLVEAGPTIEPVQLQIVCYQLWESRGKSNLIDVEDLSAIGLADDALSNYFANVVERAAAQNMVSERLIRSWVGRNLITASGLRGQVLLGMGQTDGLENEVVRMLEASYLLRSEKRRGATWFELAHDRLIEPVSRNNAAWFDHHLSLLQRQAAIWEAQGRPSGMLLSGAALAEAEAWAETHSGELTMLEHAFLSTSQQAVQLQAQMTNASRQRIVSLLAASLIVNLILILALLALTAR